MSTLSIIIANYNTADLLKKCIENLLSQNFSSSQIIIVDNASTDNSLEIVEEFFPEIHLIKSENKGLSHAYNLGVAAKTSDYYLFLGSDAFPKPGCIEGVQKFLESNLEIGIATAKLILRNGELDMDAHRSFPTPINSFWHFSGLGNLLGNNPYFGLQPVPEKPHEIDLCISHFMMVRNAVFEKIGKWDEDFFVYGEDVDFCFRTKKAGFKIYYLPQYVSEHLKGASVGIRKETADLTKASTGTKERMRKETTRAMRLFYNKHFAKTYPPYITWLVNFGINLLEKSRKS